MTLEGRYVVVRPVDPAAHGESLFAGLGGAERAPLWTYMFDGPFSDRAALDQFLRKRVTSDDPFTFAITDAVSRKALGLASLMRIDTRHRVIEVGGIIYAPELQKTRGATEAMYLLARYVFEELGYRRYEWKCNALHSASRRAALRLGFTFEGIFRQHMIIKGRTRDTAWFAMIDEDWPRIKAEFERWLDPRNFDVQGKQKTPLRQPTSASP